MRGRWFIAVSLVLVLVFALAGGLACAPEPTPTPAPAATPTPALKPTPTPIPATPTPTLTPVPKVYTLRFGTYTAIGDERTNNMRIMISELEKRSKGQLKFQFFPAEQLLKLMEAWEGVKMGLVDMYNISINHFAGITPIAEISVSPGGWDYDNVGDFLWAKGGWHEMVDKAYRKHNFTAIGYPLAGLQEWLFKEKFRTMDDFKGRKTRAPGGASARAVTLMGGTVVSVPSADVYIAAQRGLMDGCTHSLTSVMSWKEYEVMPWQVMSGLFGGGIDAIIVNLNRLNSLPPDLQDLIVKYSKDEWTYLANQNMKKWCEKTLVELAAIPGVDVYYLPQAERVRWRNACLPLFDEYVAKAGPDAESVMAVLKKTIWKQ